MYLLYELRSIEEMLKNSSNLDFIGMVVYIDDKLSAFTIGEKTNENMAIIHIEKADADIRGLYNFINVLVTIFIFSKNVSAEDIINIEIFDINNESVIKIVKSDTEIEREVEDYLKNIKGIVTKFNPIPNNGYMIKIPLDTPIMVENQFLRSFVDEVISYFQRMKNPI